MLVVKGKLFVSSPITILARRLLSASTTWSPNYKSESVNNVRMAYVDIDCRQPSKKTAVFLHGNPTSSYLWRNVIPHVAEVARCVAPDLAGMGKSDKIPNSKYTFDDHFQHLSGLLEKIDLPTKVNLVIHDWGSALGFHWANQNRDRVESITFMEGFVAPLTWTEFPHVGTELFKTFRSPLGEEMILDKNVFVEQVLPMGTLRTLAPEEIKVYVEPFKESGESRRPTLTFPREIPFEGEGPDETTSVFHAYNEWLSQSSDLPKLFIDADPGMLSPHMRKRVEKWPNLKTVTVKGLHYVQEDSPEEIGKAVQQLLSSLP